MLDQALLDMLSSPRRLAALDGTAIMDTPPAEAFDRLVRLALRALDAPNGLIAFVDAERQFFKSRVGVLGGPDPPRVLPLGWGFCPFTMATTRALVIPDAREDPVWAGNPVVRHKGVVAYLGVPLTDSEGQVLGTMCVLDHQPRRWTDGQVEILRGLAGCAMSEVQLHTELEQGRRLSEAAEHAADRERWRAMQLHALAEASLAIYSAASLGETLQVIAQSAVGLVGAHQAATVVAPDGDWLHATVSVASTPQGGARGPHPGALAGRAWMYDLVRTRGDTVRLSRAELDGHPARRHIGSADSGSLPSKSWLGVPLFASDGGCLGVLELTDCYKRELTEDDEVVLVQLAQLASVAIENTRLHEEQALLATAFQESVLPGELPHVPDVALGARYLPAQRARVSGDFYDVFPLPGAGWGIVIGDVCGKGPRAAAVAAAARHGVRAAAIDGRTPSEVLTRLHEARLIDDGDDDPAFCTAVYAILRPDALELTLASGGHPLPCVVHPDGSIDTIGEPGTLLGAIEKVRLTDRTVRLARGDVVVFFTDGLEDAEVGDREWFGSRRLWHQLASVASRGASEIADALAEAVAAPGVRQRDDVAVLVVKVE
ncbi:MAG: SpoIIE family protein phosphatase [Streptosporangiaceae bacterium]